MLNFIYPTASLRVVGGGEGVWESDSLSSPSPANWSWGQSGGRERSKLAQEGEWGTWLCSSSAVGCKDGDSRGQRVTHGGEKEGAPVSRNMVRHPGKEQKEGLKKGKSWMLHWERCKSGNQHTHRDTHTLLLPKLLPRSSASMDYPNGGHLICSERNVFQVSFYFAQEWNRNFSGYLLRKRKQTLLVATKPQ